MNKTTNISEKQIQNIINETVSEIKSDRHKKGYWKERWENQKNNNAKADRSAYWKERWAKQKAAKQAEAEKNADAPTKPHKQATKPQKDRHRKGYYHDYNQAHPERLNRGFTKGYNNGNVDDGPKEKKREWLNKTLGIYIIGYDELGRPITNDPLGDMLRNKEMEWHDDDWVEND